MTGSSNQQAHCSTTTQVRDTSPADHHDDDMPLRVQHGGPAERGPVAAQAPSHTNVLEEHHD